MSVWDEIRKMCEYCMQDDPKNNTHRHKQVSDAKALKARSKTQGSKETIPAARAPRGTRSLGDPELVEQSVLT